MTNKSRSARALRDVRVRLRDVAAASHAYAVANHDQTRRELRDEENHLEAFLDDAQHALAAARNVHDLDRVADFADDHRNDIARAAKLHEASLASMQESQQKLRLTTRELRTAERIVDRIELEIVKLEAKTEQRAHDDLGRRKQQ